MTKLGVAPTKNFREDLAILKNLLSQKENFAFSRFSDGEVYMLQNKEIILASNSAKVGDINLRGSYSEDDLKHFLPGRDEFYRQKLEEALVFRKDNYYKGLSCRCCIADGEKNFKWQLDKIGTGDEHNLTWSNLFINANYLFFINEVVPVIARRKIVMVINKLADIRALGFDIQKDFRVGNYCIQNSYGVIEDIKKWIRETKCENFVFLIAASSLSNMIIHQTYQEFDNNTFIDIGSSLNPFMPGINSRRAYMNQLVGVVDNKFCIW
jgi:hypothetical protein